MPKLPIVQDLKYVLELLDVCHEHLDNLLIELLDDNDPRELSIMVVKERIIGAKRELKNAIKR